MNDREDRLDDPIAERIASAYRDTPPLDAASRQRIDRAVAALPPPRRHAWWGERLRDWGGGRVPALALGATLAVGVVIGRWVAPELSRRLERAPANPSAGSTRVVQFVLVAPQASRVTVVGDFNGWDATATPMERQTGAGTWTAYVAVPAGRHSYAFVTDGDRWINDPLAPLAPPNEFGFRNSVIVVGEPTSL